MTKTRSALALLALILALPAQAADYPARPIKLVVPYAPGGGADGVARIVAKRASETLGQPIVIENKGGAGAILGTDQVAKAEPDGYTLLYHSTTGIVHAAVTAKLPYDWLNDLAPVWMVSHM